jgi:hypothetical protein
MQNVPAILKGYNSSVLEWYKELSTDSMSHVIEHFAHILHNRRNYINAEITQIEVTIMPQEIVSMQNIPTLLKKLLTSQRCTLRTVKNLCTLYPTGTLYDQLRIRKMTSVITYVSPRRGDISILNSKWNVSISTYRANIVWIYLRQVIHMCMRTEFGYQGKLEITIDRGQYDGFLTRGVHMRELMIRLSRVCKEWYVVLKYHCYWWGFGSMYFALTPQ